MTPVLIHPLRPRPDVDTTGEPYTPGGVGSEWVMFFCPGSCHHPPATLKQPTIDISLPLQTPQGPSYQSKVLSLKPGIGQKVEFIVSAIKVRLTLFLFLSFCVLLLLLFYLFCMCLFVFIIRHKTRTLFLPSKSTKTVSWRWFIHTSSLPHLHSNKTSPALPKPSHYYVKCEMPWLR